MATYPVSSGEVQGEAERVFLTYSVPVIVVIEDGEVTRVVVQGELDGPGAAHVENEEGDLQLLAFADPRRQAAIDVAEATDSNPWPAWEFGW